MFCMIQYEINFLRRNKKWAIVNNIEEFYSFCNENEVAFVDFRFTDLKGTASCFL